MVPLDHGSGCDSVIPTVNEQPDYMVGRRLAPIIIGLYATKGYVDLYGKPQKVDDLAPFMGGPDRGNFARAACNSFRKPSSLSNVFAA